MTKQDKTYYEEGRRLETATAFTQWIERQTGEEDFWGFITSEILFAYDQGGLFAAWEEAKRLRDELCEN